MTQKAKIMIVESDGIISGDIERTLEKLGHHVLVKVSSGKAAIEEAEKYRVDLLLTDIMLEGRMDGIEAAHNISSRFNVPVVFLSSTSDKKTIERARKVEPYGIIIKPFEEKILQATIETALYRHSMEKDGVERAEHVLSVKEGQKQAGRTKKDRENDWIRATIIVRKEYMESVKAVAYWDRKMIKDVIDEALGEYLKDKEIQDILRKKENS